MGASSSPPAFFDNSLLGNVCVCSQGHLRLCALERTILQYFFASCWSVQHLGNARVHPFLSDLPPPPPTPLHSFPSLRARVLACLQSPVCPPPLSLPSRPSALLLASLSARSYRSGMDVQISGRRHSMAQTMRRPRTTRYPPSFRVVVGSAEFLGHTFSRSLGEIARHALPTRGVDATRKFT